MDILLRKLTKYLMRSAPSSHSDLTVFRRASHATLFESRPYQENKESKALLWILYFQRGTGGIRLLSWVFISSFRLINTSFHLPPFASMQFRQSLTAAQRLSFEPLRYQKNKKEKANALSLYFLRYGRDSNPRMLVLQTNVLPLHHRTKYYSSVLPTPS